MSVPAHTRLDAHPEGDPYESWAKDNAKKDFGGITITKFNNLDDFFDILADYSSKYFFSKDTINTNLLKNLKTKTIFLDNKIIDCILSFEENNKEFCIISSDKNFINPQKRIYYFTSINHADYYSLLAPKAISYGAGVIDLFFKEAEIAEQKQREKSWLEKLKEKIFPSDQVASVLPLPSLSPSSSPSFSPSPSPSLAFIPSSFPIFTPAPSILPSLSPTPSPLPTPRVGSDTPGIIEPKFSANMPYPGFGGGGAPPSPTSNVNPEPTPAPEPSPTPTPEPSPEPSPEPTPTPTPIPDPEYMDVVINEIAWAGTSNQTSQDEWIELYNRTSRDINLDGWILYSETDEKPWINLSGPIPAQGYYLIERSDDDETVSDILADWKGSFGNGLNNRGEVLILSQASTTIDQTVLCGGANPYQWPPCYDYSYRSMERINPDIAGTDSSNWGINNGLIINGKTSKGEAVFGTPKARNSANYLIASGNPAVYFDATITLKKSSSPYIVNNQIQVFQDNAVLNIEPGVVIKFYNDAGLRFSGNSKIIAKGTADEPIVFTSFDDDEYGGDTNNNSTSTAPYPGGWFGVEIETSNSDSVFENSIFRYGGKYYSGWGIFNSLGPSNLHIKGISAQIANSVFEYSRAHGLYLASSDSIVSGSVIRNNNGSNPAGYNAGILISGGAPKILNNTVSGNGYGISMANCEAIVDSNVFDSNEREAIVSSGKFGVFTNNSGANNLINAIAVSGELARENSISTASPNPLPYYFWMVSVASSSTLMIEPGAVIKGSYNNPVNVYGNLIISGVNSGDVVFTSLYDDSIGGDADNDGGIMTISKGDWPGIVMRPGSYSEISGAAFKYADTVLTYQNSPINLSNVKFISNTLAISADSDSAVQSAATTTLEFIDNTTDISPADLW